MADDRTDASARLVLQAGVALLRPDQQLFEAMLEGWRRQQLSRNLAFGTIERRLQLVCRFQAFTNDYPWCWTPVDLEEWIQELRGPRARARATVRGYQNDLRSFLAYATDPVYGWAEECSSRFGSHPVQICNRWNTARHLADFEGRPTRRALGRQELQNLFDAADEDVARSRRLGRKGWVGLFRDATVFKVAYAWGLRRREVQMLDLADFGANPQAPEFGAFGAAYVRYGKGSHGSGPRRRTVLTVMPWSTDVLAQWIEDVRPRFNPGASQSLCRRSVRCGWESTTSTPDSLRCASASGSPPGRGCTACATPT